MKNVFNNLLRITRNCFRSNRNKSNISKSIEKQTTDKIDLLVPIIYLLTCIFVMGFVSLIFLIYYWIKTNI